MAEVTETQLPGVGVRYEFTTDDGERVGVLWHHSGRREVVVYDRDDPDVGRTVLHLEHRRQPGPSTELLGAAQVSEAVGAVQQRIEGLAIEWVEVAESSPTMAGRPSARASCAPAPARRSSPSSAAGHHRARTRPRLRARAGDVVVAVGTPDGLEQLRAALRA